MDESLNILIQAYTRQTTDASQRIVLRESSPQKKLEFSFQKLLSKS